MTDWRDDQEPERDPRLAELLRGTEGDAPLDEVNWEGLHAAIRERAALPLARARHHGAAEGEPVAPPSAASAVRLPRPRHRTSWWPRVVPVAAAAALIVAVGLQLREPAAAPGAQPEQAAAVSLEFLSAEEALAAEVSESEFRAWVNGVADAEALLWLAAAE